MTPPTKSCMCTIAIRSYTRLIQPPASGADRKCPPALWDMAYSSTHSTEERPLFSCIYDGYFYPCKDPMAIGGPKINAKTNLNAWNAESFVAVACLGTANYLGYECDRYLCMDDKDGLWNIFIYYGKDESGTVGYYSAVPGAATET